MVLGKLNTHMQNYKIEYIPDTIHKNQHKNGLDFYIKPETIKLLECLLSKRQESTRKNEGKRRPPHWWLICKLEQPSQNSRIEIP